MSIEQYLHNKKEATRTHALESVEIFGSEGNVEKMAALWQIHGGLLKQAELTLLLDYCQTSTFSKEQFDAFRMGLGAMNMVLDNCLSEVQNRVKHEE